MGSARDDTAVRSTLGSYRLFGEVGRDPLGGSYLACPAGVQTFPKWAVVRRLHSGVARDPVMVHAFLAATQAAVRMVHPNVASTFDFGGKMTLPWAAREHMLGVAVLDLIARLVDKKTKVPWALASYLVAQAADGVAAVRSRLPAHGPPIGFLTGAVAPSVFVTGGGEVKIVDGCLPLIDGLPLIDSRALPYRPREPVAAGVNAGRADAFGLGVILWELVAGRRLFAGRDDDETHRLLDAKVVPALRSPSRTPPIMDDIVLRALGKSGDHAPRSLSAADVSQDLRAALAVQGKRVGANDVARLMQEMFSPLLAEQEVALRDAWATEQAYQARGDVPADVTSDGDVTRPVGETARDETTETAIAPRTRSMTEDGFDDVPTVMRGSSAGPLSWRAQAPVDPELLAAPPRIEFVEGRASSSPFAGKLPPPTPPPSRQQPPSTQPSPGTRRSAQARPNDAAALTLDLDDDELIEERTQEKLDYEPAVIISPTPLSRPESQPRTRRAQPDPLPLPPIDRGPASSIRRAEAAAVASEPGQAPQTSLLVTGAVCFSVSLLGIFAVAISRPGSDASSASTSSQDTTSFHAPTTPPPSPTPRAPTRSIDPWTPIPASSVPAISPSDLPHAVGPSPTPSPVRYGRGPSQPSPSPPPPPVPSGPTGLLTVFCTPACDRVLDGSRSLGPSPVFKLPVSAGVHRIHLHVDGISPDKSVTATVREGDTTVVRETVGP